MLLLLACISVLALAIQALPNVNKREGPVPGYKRASLLELKGAEGDIIQVTPLSFELQQRYQLKHANEVADIEPEQPITVGKATKVMKMGRPKVVVNSNNSNKIRLVVGMDERGEVRMMQIPKYNRGDAWEQQL